jgi:dipeptidyl aminopeptidase/acylaminoacyl peptidase
MTKTVKIEDLYNFESLASPEYNLAGDKLLYIRTKLMKSSDNYISTIHLYDLKQKRDQVLIKNNSLNIEPKWEQNAAGFYFISDKSGSRQLFYYDFATQSSTQLTTESTGILDYEIHPSGKYLFYLTMMKKIAPKKPFTTRRALYQANGQGLIADDDHFRKLWVFNLADKSKHYLTSVSYGFGAKKAFAISPDGKKLVFENQVAKNDDFNFSEELCLLTLDGNCSLIVEKESLTATFFPKGLFSDPCFSADGKYLGFLGNEDPYKNSNQTKMYVYDFAKKQILSDFAKKDLQAADSCVTDFQQNNTKPLLQWNGATKQFVFVVSENGKVGLLAADPKTQEIRAISVDNEHIQDFALAPNSGKLALVISRPNLPTGLFEQIADGQKIELATNIQQQWQDYAFATYQAFEFKSQVGERIPCFLVLPPLLKQDQAKIPLVLDIHGGPHAMHGYTFHHEVQTLAAQQMAVLLVNPRGSFGYGQAFADGVVGGYGQGDYQDLMIALDEILKLYPIIDRTKLFVTGGSYGGFMTNWIVGHTDRFKRAATQRSISNFVSMSGTSDIGYWFNTSEAGGSNILQPQKLWEESPIAYINQVKTPTLILHSDQDLRCPLEQGQQWFIALKTKHVSTKFIEFFGESHELSRSGKPSNRARRLLEIIKCFTEEDYFEH